MASLETQFKNLNTEHNMTHKSLILKNDVLNMRLID